MLKYRLLTALILIPIVIATIFLLPPYSFITAALFVFLLAGWEWANLVGFTHFVPKTIYLVLLAISLLLALFAVPLPVVILLGIVWWLVAIVLLALYPRVNAWGKKRYVLAIMGFLVLIPVWVGVVMLQMFSPMLLFFCLLLIWGVDSAAFFVGRRWGSHKLAPEISPGKSYEGLLGGIVAAVIISTLGWFVLGVPAQRVWLFFFICVFGGAIISVMGDLFESMVKRQSHVKDSGTLLPGHGGILDRIDSLTTAIPFFALILPYFFSA